MTFFYIFFSLNVLSFILLIYILSHSGILGKKKYWVPIFVSILVYTASDILLFIGLKIAVYAESISILSILIVYTLRFINKKNKGKLDIVKYIWLLMFLVAYVYMNIKVLVSIDSVEYGFLTNFRFEKRNNVIFGFQAIALVLVYVMFFIMLKRRIKERKNEIKIEM